MKRFCRQVMDCILNIISHSEWAHVDIIDLLMSTESLLSVIKKKKSLMVNPPPISSRVSPIHASVLLQTYAAKKNAQSFCCCTMESVYMWEVLWTYPTIPTFPLPLITPQHKKHASRKTNIWEATDLCRGWRIKNWIGHLQISSVHKWESSVKKTRGNQTTSVFEWQHIGGCLTVRLKACRDC